MHSLISKIEKKNKNKNKTKTKTKQERNRYKNKIKGELPKSRVYTVYKMEALLRLVVIYLNGV